MANGTKNDRWVEKRLASLQPPAGWRPDPAASLSRVWERDRAYRKRRTRWVWISCAASVAFLFVMAAPARCDAANSNSCGQPLAGRLWSAVFPKHEEVRPAPQTPEPTPAVVTPPAPPVQTAQAAKPPQPGRKTATPANAAPMVTNYKEFGAPDAPVVCEIFTDYECPACASLYANFVPQFIQQYVQTGKVKLVHRDFPLPMHPYARVAAQYANAAGLFGEYDVVVNRLFQTQNTWANDGNVDAQVAQVLAPGVMQRVRELVRQGDPRLEQTVAADVAMGTSDQIRQTPTLVFVSKGKRQPIAGIPDFGLLKNYLDQLLAK